MSSQEVGRILRQEREEHGLELEDVARATRIRSHYLKALEEGEFGLLPSSAQVSGFLRTYAEYLEMDPDPLFKKLQLRAQEIEVAAQAAEAAPPAKDAAAASETEAQIANAFAAIGTALRQRRESLELDLIELEEQTHIPEHYLQRLENGEFDSFPSPTQARGMLGNYADFLGLESDALLSRYAEALQVRFQQRQAARPARRTIPRPKIPKLVFRPPAWLQPLLSGDLLVWAVAGLALLVFVIFSIGRIAATRAGQQPELTAPPLVGLLIPSPTLATQGASGAINLLEQQTATPGLLGEAAIQVTNTGSIALRVLATQRTWMRVIADGQEGFEGRTVPGQSYTFSANNQILLVASNGAGLRVFFNEQDLGILGVFGEIVELVFTTQGATTPTLSPTPTINPDILTATAGVALTPSTTPSPSATPSPTATPSATPTVDTTGTTP